MQSREISSVYFPWLGEPTDIVDVEITYDNDQKEVLSMTLKEANTRYEKYQVLTEDQFESIIIEQNYERDSAKVKYQAEEEKKRPREENQVTEFFKSPLPIDMSRRLKTNPEDLRFQI